MTLTAPIPLPTFDLAAAIRAGIHLVGQTAHIPAADAHADAHADAVAQLAGAQRRITAAIVRRLDAVAVSLDEGWIGWLLTPEAHGDGWMLEGVWRAL